MTVCIGSLATRVNLQSKNVVVASDRMVSLGSFMEFEHEVSKITKLTSKCVAMVAGDTLTGSKIVNIAKSKLESADTLKIVDIAALVSKVYSECRDEIVDEQVFRPRGITRKLFYDEYQNKMLSQLVYQLDQITATWNVNVELIIAGVDEMGSHIYTVNNPGTYIDVQQIGYTAIGSGGVHATQALIGFGSSPEHELKRTIFCTFAAKKRGEVAPGVGKDTDLFIITKDGIQELTQDQIQKLEDIYSYEYNNPLTNSVTEKVQSIDFIKTGEYE